MSNMFLKLGEIKGESGISGYEGQIEVYSFSYDCSQPTSPIRSNVGPTSSRASHGFFHFTKQTDMASADICKNLWSGAVLKEAVFTACRMDGAQALAYLEIKMENVVIAHFSVSGGGGVPHEEVSLNFSKLTYTYKSQKQEGGSEGNLTVTHDLKTNAIS